MPFGKKAFIVSLIALFLGLGMANHAIAALIDYPEVSGQNVDFINISEESVTDTPPLYGEPMIVGDMGLFFPTSFSSSSSNGSADTTAGTLSMTLRAHDGWAIRSVAFYEYGSYTLTGGGGDATAGISGALTVGSETPVDLAPLDFSLSGGQPSGTYSTSATVNLFEEAVTEIDLQLFSSLYTSSDSSPSTEAEISIHAITEQPQLVVQTEPVPLPASVLLLGSGLCSILGLRRFRKNR